MSYSTLSTSFVLRKGLLYIGILKHEFRKWSNETKVEVFRAHYGSSPGDVTSIWNDLCDTDIKEAALKEKEKSEKGFKRYMIAHFFCWSYPRNVQLISSRFKICLRYLGGKELWYWPKKIAALKKKVIVWPKSLKDQKTAIISLSVDGINFKSWEKVCRQVQCTSYALFLLFHHHHHHPPHPLFLSYHFTIKET